MISLFLLIKQHLTLTKRYMSRCEEVIKFMGYKPNLSLEGEQERYDKQRDLLLTKFLPYMIIEAIISLLTLYYIGELL